MGYFTHENNVLIWQEAQHKTWLQPWGTNGLRVQANLEGKPLDLPQALIDIEVVPSSAINIEIGEDWASIRNGAIQAIISTSGRIRYERADSGALLFEEPERTYYGPSSRNFRPRDGRLYKIEAWFQAQDGERVYGLGQHKHGRLDQKGCVIELQQRNTEVAIPFLLSNRGYGFLWNNPGVGRVELGCNATRWVADGSQQMDYYVVCGDTPSEILARYADATGHAPDLPQWASGFWQCKLRYETQEELLNVAREYTRRGLPLSVIVIDFFNWSHMGDWRFDPVCWSDPEAMTRELEDMGVKAMVSVWPTVSPLSENYATLRERGWLVKNERGTEAQQIFIDNEINGPAYLSYYDATNPDARQFMWDTVKRNYYAQGVKLWWLDSNEPDINPWYPENVRFALGNGLEVANIYPMMQQKAFYDGMRAAGETDIMTLGRSGWAGSQRFSAAIWSGDIASTFEALQAQVRAGLNIAISGIPWWTTDIGGFHGGNIETPYFRELIVRWFQYGVFCPLFRLHGHRQPFVKGDLPRSGADNEVWSFGEEAYAIIRELLFLRERLRPYIHAQMQIASAQGLPTMRPLFVDFPDDEESWTIEDQFMFGPDLLAAPVVYEGARSREVYLPAGTAWTDAWTKAMLDGGQWITADAPLDRIPLYVRFGKDLPIVPDSAL